MKNNNFLHLVLLLLFVLINFCASDNVKKSIDDRLERDDTGEVNDDTKDESLEIPVESDANSNLKCTRRQNSQMHEIQNAQNKQFPFMIAVMSQQGGYLCSGSLVANGVVLTTAKCTQQSVSHVLLNITNADNKKASAVMLHVIKTEKFPTFLGSESLKDVGIIYTEKHDGSYASKIKLSKYTNARNITDVQAIGFGLNTDVGQPKDLQYIGMELRSPLESDDVLKAYFDCIETNVSTCFKDTGGPVIFNNELIGIVIKGQEDCTKEMSATYAVNKKMADILPTYTFKAWLDDKISKIEEHENEVLQTYPAQPRFRAMELKSRHALTDAAAEHGLNTATVLLNVFIILNYISN